MSKDTHACPVCGKEHESEFAMKVHRGRAHSSPWDDAETLRELYHDKGMSYHEMADHFDTSYGAIQKAMDRHEVKRNKSRGDPTRPAYHGFDMRESRPIGTCSETVSSWVNGKNQTVKIHRLIAVAHGKLDPEDMWNSDLKVHHKSGHGLDNRPENVEVVTRAEHREAHAGSPYRTTTE